MKDGRASGVSCDDEGLKAFTRDFFTALGAAPMPVRSNLWRVDLTPEQKAVLTPLPSVPWWASPPPAPEPATWWLAFDHGALAAEPQARLLTRGSQLFQQMRSACQGRGAVFTGTLLRPASDAFRPVLWLHLRLSRRGGRSEDVLAPWACRLDDGCSAWAPPPDPLHLRPGPPPPGARIERIRVEAEDVWQRLQESLMSKEEARRDGWEREALARLREEIQAVEHYYDALLAQNPENAEDLERERERRLAEVHGRHKPTVWVRPVAASLIYLPTSVDYPAR